MRARARSDGWLAVAVGVPAGLIAATSWKLAAAVIAVPVVAILMLTGAEYLLLGVVAVEPWTDALNFPTATITIPKIVGFLAICAFALSALTGQARLRFTPQMGWAFAFFGVVVLSLVVGPAGSTGTTISYALYILFLGLFVQSIRTPSDAERCLAVYAASIALGTFYGLATFLGGVSHLASGPIGDPNDYASTLAGGLPLAVYFAVHSERWRWLWRIGCALIVATMLATLSRGALVGFVVVVVWALAAGRVSLRGVLAGALVLLVAVAIGFVFFKPIVDRHIAGKSAYATVNVNSREAFWMAAIHMAEDHPLLGVGPNGFPAEASHYIVNDPIVLINPETHNSYLQVLAEDGIFAILLFLAFLASTARALLVERRLARAAADPKGVDLADALMASLLWTIVTMIFVTRALAFPVWLFSGMAGALLLARRADGSTLTSGAHPVATGGSSPPSAAPRGVAVDAAPVR